MADNRCAVGVPIKLMEELRKIRDEHHTSIVGAIAILINFYRDKQK